MLPLQDSRSPPHPLLARSRGPEAPRPCHPRPRSALSPFSDYMPRGRCGHYCPPRPGKRQRARRPAQQPAAGRWRTASVQSWRRCPPGQCGREGTRQLLTAPEPPLLGKAAPATPTCRFPTTHKGKPKESVGPGPTHLPGPQPPWQSVPADKGDIPGASGALLFRAGPPHPAQ